MNMILSDLSNREQEVTAKVAEGLANKVIANELSISERTVKFHCANIYRKLKIRNRHMLVAWYLKSQYDISRGQSR